MNQSFILNPPITRKTSEGKTENKATFSNWLKRTKRESNKKRRTAIPISRSLSPIKVYAFRTSLFANSARQMPNWDSKYCKETVRARDFSLSLFSVLRRTFIPKGNNCLDTLYFTWLWSGERLYNNSFRR